MQFLLISTFIIITHYINGNKISNNIEKINGNKISNNIEKINLNKIYKMAILSKTIYDYDFNNKNKKDSLCLLSKFDLKNNLSIDTIKTNNIYFNTEQYVSYLNTENFSKEAKNYLDFISNNFPDTEIYGYFNNKNRLHSLIIINHKIEEINIVFRGSMYFDEWINNLLIKESSIPFNNLKIHSGILKLYKHNDINNNILYILKNLFEYFPKYKKIFGGHSKGTILSFLTIIDLLYILDYDYTYEVICFGSPQILNKNIADFLHNNDKIKISNVINENDIICNLPFNNKYQVGLEILMKNNDIMINEYDKPYNSKINVFNNFFKSISNHDLKKYIHKLKKY
jgi:hypothetical protein